MKTYVQAYCYIRPFGNVVFSEEIMQKLREYYTMAILSYFNKLLDSK